MSRVDNCPHCGVSLIGGAIPQELLDKTWKDSKGEVHKVYGDATHWRRDIGVEHPLIYDGTLYYRCPDCNGEWNRWPNNEWYKRLYDAAEREMRAARRRAGLCTSTYTEPRTGEVRRCTFKEGHLGKNGFGKYEHGIVGLRTWPDEHADAPEEDSEP